MSLEELKLKYVDLFLIHFPVGLHCEDDDDLFPEDDSGNSVLDMNTDLVALWQVICFCDLVSFFFLNGCLAKNKIY